MSEANTYNENQEIELSSLPDELRQVIEFEEIPAEMFTMIFSIHEVSEEAVRESWDALPASAQNILDNFEQFHALISVSQAFAGMNVMEEFPTLDLPKEMTEEDKEAYRSQLLDDVLFNCVKDMTKQLKKARRDAVLKRDFRTVFSK
ncbi:DUF3069 domain-containing protein [Vibrio palustris]|uniref:DUF3069 domain-containing protein n=1 Tax=Vibrio palustris TaxID=1918946 RepID=A0A1R4B4I5_9VIBR|nr:DUF3069 domain-containing protein [Vibrio palustris]SJL83827.1 hypothetical protein VPAL9027_01806 [Vibrio palustris]